MHSQFGGEFAHSNVRVPKASERIAERLRGQIVRGEIPPGDMLPPEKRMVEDLGVSRPTLREAFRILESEGLITVLTGPRGGPQVRLPDLSVASRHIGLYLQTRGATLADLLEARAEFSAICVRLLAKRCTRKGLEELTACVQEQQGLWEAGIDGEADFARWVALTGDFHNLIALHCQNKTLEAQSKSLADVLGAHRVVSIRRRADPDAISDTSYIPGVIADYAKLVRLVGSGNAVAVEKHWRAHLYDSAELVYRNREKESIVSLFD